MWVSNARGSAPASVLRRPAISRTKVSWARSAASKELPSFLRNQTDSQPWWSR
jgi:hypothetical protein